MSTLQYLFVVLGQTARVFSSNSLVRTITAAIQYILAVASSFGSQDYHNNSLMTILGIACILFDENEQHRLHEHELSFL